MSQVRFGDMVWTEMADANGIRKNRPAVVITPDDDITPTGLLEVVAITSFLPDPLPADHVLLPWHAQRHPRTGLNRQCAAVCSWTAKVAPQDIHQVVGKAPDRLMIEIITKAIAAKAAGKGTPPP